VLWFETGEAHVKGQDRKEGQQRLLLALLASLLSALNHSADQSSLTISGR
jgi:hypothetical protein